MNLKHYYDIKNNVSYKSVSKVQPTYKSYNKRDQYEVTQLVM